MSFGLRGMRFTPATLSSPSSLSSLACFSLTACSEKGWQPECVCDSQHGKKRALLRNYKQDESHIHHKPQPATKDTVHNSLCWPATGPCCNNGCFLKAEVTLILLCVKAQEPANRKEPGSYSTSSHYSEDCCRTSELLSYS